MLSRLKNSSWRRSISRIGSSPMIRLVVPTIAVVLVLPAIVQGGDCCSKGKTGADPRRAAAIPGSMPPGHRAPDKPSWNPYADLFKSGPFKTQGPGAHGGQIAAINGYQFEVVYTPSETRVYVYEATGKSLAAGGIRGGMVMEVVRNPQLFEYPVKAETDQAGESFLVVPVDVSRIRDGDMQVTFDLAGMPLRDARQVRFTQTFALTKLPAPEVVNQVALVSTDQALIARQRTCPVTGEPLGSMGAPIKLLVQNRLLFVCCQGCVSKVMKDPDRFCAEIGAPETVTHALGAGGRADKVGLHDHRGPSLRR